MINRRLFSKLIVNDKMEMKEKKPNAIKTYRKILKEEGVSGFIKKVGWKVAFLVFMFFFVKGLIWLFIFYGGYELIRQVF